MIAFRKRNPKNAERGVALILAMLVLLLVSAIGMGMLMLSNAESDISSNFRDQQVAYFAAKAGMEEVRDRLLPSAPNSLSAFLPTSVAGANNSVLYVINPGNTADLVSPWTVPNGNAYAYGKGYPDLAICNRMNCPGGATPASAWYTSQLASPAYAAAPAVPWKWVRVIAKTNAAPSNVTNVISVDGSNQATRVCWNGSNEVTIPNSFADCPTANSGYQQVYELTSLAITRAGSRRFIQAEVAATPPLAFPAAVGVVSGGQTQCQMQGGTISGVDQSPVPGPSVAGIAYSNAGTCAIQGATVAGGGNCTATPNVCQNVPMGAFTAGTVLANTIANIKAQADNVFTGNVPSPQNTNGTLGTCPTNPKTTVVNSANAAFSAVTGCGILLIDAGAQTQLQIDGNINWMGPVIVYSTSGQVQVQIGTGTGAILGAMMIANNANAQVQFQFQGSGPAGGIKYSSYYDGILKSGPFKAIAVHELVY